MTKMNWGRKSVRHFDRMPSQPIAKKWAIKLIDQEWKRAEDFNCDTWLLTECEEIFVERARAQMMPVHRPSWPDFIVDTPSGLVAVEVKSPNDDLSDNQVRTLNILVRMGVRCYIWTPREPNKLQPWNGKKIKAARDNKTPARKNK